jgi:hypothetical protein
VCPVAEIVLDKTIANALVTPPAELRRRLATLAPHQHHRAATLALPQALAFALALALRFHRRGSGKHQGGGQQRGRPDDS